MYVGRKQLHQYSFITVVPDMVYYFANLKEHDFHFLIKACLPHC